MSELIVPDAIAAQLQGLAHPVNLIDGAGKKLGCFVPALDLSDYEIIAPDATEEELRAAEESDEWYSTKEVLGHLENLE